ncbi:MAG TPA: alkyl hydroperoxide reductase [Hyphomonadaceae bacterium]|nr:alkyl hydroperoxide reductase [Hyphomonadaceae bacterium]
MHMPSPKPASEWRTTEWFNAPKPPTLAGLRGKVVFVTAFQMLCPSCVSHGLPQALRVREAFREDDVAVIGLHTVFEHHAAMSPVSLKAFLYEYRVGFPVGIDEPDSADGPPLTMRAYEMRGTPTTLLIDREGKLRTHAFGHLPDLQLGAEITALLAERPLELTAAGDEGGRVCTPEGCS